MYDITERNPGPRGTRHQTGVPYEMVETADGQMVINVPNRRWKTFAEDVLMAPDLAEYNTQQQRQEHYEELMSVLRPRFREKTIDEWTEILDDLGCPNGPFNQVSDVIEHPQAQARDYVFEYSDPNVGEVLLHGHPFHLSKTDKEIRSGPPLLGQHTDEVLRERLGLSDEEIDELLDKNVIT